MEVHRFTFSLFQVNTYVTVDPVTRQCAIIDPGMSDEMEQRQLTGFIERNGLKVTHIINTHLHVDHAAGDQFTRRQYDVAVLGHKDDEPLGKSLKEQARMFGILENIESVSLTSYLNDGDIVRIGEGRLQVIFVPGHSPGSIALYDPDSHYVITGDALFAGSVGRADLPGGSMPRLMQSIKQGLMSLPDDTVVYPGHGPETTIGYERATNPYLR